MELKRVTVDIFPENDIHPENLGGEKVSDEERQEEYFKFEEIKSKVKDKESRRLEMFDDNIEDLNESIKNFGNLLENTKYTVLFVNYDIVSKDIEDSVEYEGKDEDLYIEVEFNGSDIRYYPHRNGISFLIKLDKEDHLAKQEHLDRVEEFIEYTKENPDWVKHPKEYRVVSEECYTYQDEIKNKEELELRAGEVEGKQVIIYDVEEDARVFYSLTDNHFLGSSKSNPKVLEESIEEFAEAMGMDEIPEFECYPYYEKVTINTEENWLYPSSNYFFLFIVST